MKTYILYNPSFETEDERILDREQMTEEEAEKRNKKLQEHHTEAKWIVFTEDVLA